MTRHKKILCSLAIFFFSLGMVFSMALAGIASWEDLEATFYGFQHFTNDRLTTLRCPVLMTTNGTGIISASVSNPSNVTVESKLRIFVSGPGPFRTEDAQITLGAGKTQQVQWTVTAKDVDYRFLIMAEVLAFPYSSMSTREATCGILVLKVPGLTGSQLFDSALAVALSGLMIGLGLWFASGSQSKKRILDSTNALTLLAILTLLDMFFSFRGIWIFGILLFLATFLLIIVVFANAAQSR